MIDHYRLEELLAEYESRRIPKIDLPPLVVRRASPSDNRLLQGLMRLLEDIKKIQKQSGDLTT